MFRLDARGGVVRLTVTEAPHESHDEKYKEGGRRGSPMMLCELKILLETGCPLSKFDRSA
jgi:hypothetical protein